MPWSQSQKRVKCKIGMHPYHENQDHQAGTRGLIDAGVFVLFPQLSHTLREEGVRSGMSRADTVPICAIISPENGALHAITATITASG